MMGYKISGGDDPSVELQQSMPMRFLVNLISLGLLILAVIAGGLDAIRSVAVESVHLTALRDAWAGASPQTLQWLEDLVSRHLGTGGLEALGAVTRQPAFAVLAGLALLLYVIGFRGNVRHRRFYRR
jgi:hypothetical protein